MALERRDRIFLFICSLAAVVAIILGALSIGRTITFQTGSPGSCASGTFSVEFPSFWVRGFPGICSSVENATGMLEGAVLSFGITGIVWPIYYYVFLSDVRCDNPRILLFGNDQPDADFLLRILSIVGSSVYITLFYQLELGDATAASIEGAVNAFSAVAIIGGGIQLAFFLFRKKHGLLSSDGNMDGEFNYVQM